VAVAPVGRELTLQVGAAAGLGPLLVQVTVPVAVLPAIGLLGKPATVAAMSACGTMVMGLVSALLTGIGSAVVLPAVVVIFKGPAPGAAKVEVQVIAAPKASGLGTGLGVQVWVAPAGRPLSTQVAVAAALGPLLVQVPLTVTGCPALTLAGTVVAACMSACGTTLVTCCAVLFAGLGSAVLLPAVPVAVTLPLTGAV
jgi:hypothetical protein